MVKVSRVSPKENVINLPFEVVVDRLLATKPKPKTAKKKATPKKKKGERRR